MNKISFFCFLLFFTSSMAMKNSNGLDKWLRSTKERLSKKIYSAAYIRSLINNLSLSNIPVFDLRIGENKDTVLHYCLKNKYYGLIEELVNFIIKSRSGVVLLVKNKLGQTPLEIAIKVFPPNNDIISILADTSLVLNFRTKAMCKNNFLAY